LQSSDIVGYFEEIVEGHRRFEKCRGNHAELHGVSTQKVVLFLALFISYAAPWTKIIDFMTAGKGAKCCKSVK
jgi:hypothetical protein